MLHWNSGQKNRSSGSDVIKSKHNKCQEMIETKAIKDYCGIDGIETDKKLNPTEINPMRTEQF